MAEHVNHPKHYNARKDGLECIDIIRHYSCDIANALKYLWRAGDKKEEGITDREKEIEDLRKSIWYINDYYSHNLGDYANEVDIVDMVYYVRKVTGYSVQEIIGNYSYETKASIYPPTVTNAIIELLTVGLVINGYCYVTIDWRSRLETARDEIQKRIEELEQSTN
jgi:predicted DNA-binding transcriptional regulator